MAFLFPAQAKVNPSFSEPDLIITYAQASGFMGTMEKSRPRVKIGNDDLWVYVNKLDIRTSAQTSQAGMNWLPSASIQAEFSSVQTYLLRNREVWDDEMMRAAGRYNVSLPNAAEEGMRQGIFQRLRSMYLYGVVAANNEGLLNTQGAVTATLPADSYGNTTVVDYDNGDMASYLLSEITQLQIGMFQSGSNISNRIVVLSPQREFLNFQQADIVQVTSYQRPGGGTNTVAGTMQKVLEEAGHTVEWYYDDTLIGKGAGGTDMVIVTIPEIETPVMDRLNTNIFGALNPKSNAVNVMYNDVAAPIKIATPTPDGAIAEVLQMRATPGWCWRPQGLLLISMPYN